MEDFQNPYQNDDSDSLPDYQQDLGSNDDPGLDPGETTGIAGNADGNGIIAQMMNGSGNAASKFAGSGLRYGGAAVPAVYVFKPDYTSNREFDNDLPNPTYTGYPHGGGTMPDMSSVDPGKFLQLLAAHSAAGNDGNDSGDGDDGAGGTLAVSGQLGGDATMPADTAALQKQFMDGERQYIVDHERPAVPIFKDATKASEVSDYSLNKLNRITQDAGLDINRIRVTSTHRTPEEQANIMYDQIQNGTQASYSDPGQQVQEICRAGMRKGQDRATIVAAMLAKTNALLDQDQYVSEHFRDPSDVNVFDISPNMSKAEQLALAKALERAKQNGDISNYHSPVPGYGGKDYSFHVEIKQPKPAPSQAN